MSRFLVEKSPGLILFQFHHINNFKEPSNVWSKTEIEIGESENIKMVLLDSLKTL